MKISVRILMVDEEQVGFVTSLTVGSFNSDLSPIPTKSFCSETVTESWNTAQRYTEQTVRLWSIEPKQLNFSIGESDLNRSAAWMEGTDGKSLGMAFYIASVAAHLGVRLRQDIVFTGCLEESGNFRYPGALKQKVLGRFGAINDCTALKIIVAPPPQSSSELSGSPEKEYLDILEQFSKSNSERSFLILHKIEDLWVADIITQILDKNSWFLFLLNNKNLLNKFNPDVKQPLAVALEKFCQYYRHSFWLDFDHYLYRTPNAIEYFQEHLRDLAMEYFADRDGENLSRLLSSLGRNMSYESLLDFVTLDDLRIAFLHEFPKALENSYRACREQFNRTFSCMRSPINPEILQRIISDEFISFNNLMNHITSLLEVFFDIDPSLAKESYARINLFAELEMAIRQLRERKLNDVTSFVNNQILARPVRRLARIRIGLLDNVAADKQGKSCLTDKKAAMNVRISADLSELQFEIIEEVAKDILSDEKAEVKQLLFPIKGNNAISNPVLLWQQSYESLCLDWQADDYKEENCAILNLPDGHLYCIDKGGVKHKTKGLIQRLFSKAPMIISFTSNEAHATSVFWSNQYRWPPSIDSLWFASILEKMRICEESNRLVADVGSGTGFLGIFYAQNCSHVRLAVFSDLNRSLTLLTEHNCKRNLRNSPNCYWQYKTITARGLACYRQFVHEYGKLDLCLCAPPYLPQVKKYEIASGLSVAVSGTQLLEDLVLEGRDITKTLVVQFSAIALAEFEQACERAGVVPVCLATRDVPLRIDMIQPYHPQLDYKIDPNDKNKSHQYQYYLDRYIRLKKYNEFLQNERDLKCLNKGNYKWWHELRVYRIDYH